MTWKINCCVMARGFLDSGDSGSIDVAPNGDDPVRQGLKQRQVNRLGLGATDSYSILRLGVVVVVVVVAVSGERAWDAGDKGPKSRHRVG